jgi:hypothetical protein
MFILVSALCISIFIFYLLNYALPHPSENEFLQPRFNHWFKTYRLLRILIIILYALYALYGSLYLFDYLRLIPLSFRKPYQLTYSVVHYALLAVLYQLTTTITYITQPDFYILSNRKARTISLLVSPFANGVKTAVIVVVFQKAVESFYTPVSWLPEIATIKHVILIIGIAWFLYQMIQTLENIFGLRYSLLDEDLLSRKTYTHIVIIKRLAVLLLTMLTVAALLMTFQEVRNLGKGVLISTGILTAVFGVSSKQPIEGLLRGIQLAIAQPIRLNDTIIIEGEVGVISAINLTHVIVTLWDKRQMIVPTNYFLEKPFQNWTHESKELLGTIFFYVDYQLPIEPIRQKFHEYLHANELGLWNGHAGLLQVTDIRDNTVELRMLVSADDPDKLFDLRCDIREKMLYTIQQSYPEGLPKLRFESPTPRHHVETT